MTNPDSAAVAAIRPDVVVDLDWVEISRRCWDADGLGKFYRVFRNDDGGAALKNSAFEKGTPFPTIEAALSAALAQAAEPVFVMCEACGSLVGEPQECDCTKMETGTQRLIGLYRCPLSARPSPPSEAVEARRLALEEAAKIADRHNTANDFALDDLSDLASSSTARCIASDIRALTQKDKAHE